jgi:hypothetical protein
LKRAITTYVEFLQDLIRIPTVNPWFVENKDVCREGDAQRFIRSHMEKLGAEIDMWEPDVKSLKKYDGQPGYYESHTFDDRPNLAARVKGTGKGKSILLMGHIDWLNEDWAKRKTHPLLSIPCQVLVGQINAGEFPSTYANQANISFDIPYLPSERDKFGGGGNVMKEFEDFIHSVSQTDPWLRENPPEVTWMVNADCGETPVDHEIVQLFLKNLSDLGLPSVAEGCYFHTDMGWQEKAGIPTVNFGPGDPKVIPYNITRIRYNHFSLQGQPRPGIQKLREVFLNVGIKKHSKVGLVGYKYFEGEEVDDACHSFDVPEYIVKELYEIADNKYVYNFTKELTGLPNGLRMKIRTAEEIAYIDYQATQVANVIRRLIKSAKVGMSETDLAKLSNVGFTPTPMFPMVNFGAESVSKGLESPRPFSKLTMGDVMSLCYALRGSLCCRAGIGAVDKDSVLPELRDTIEEFLMVYWKAIALWYETIKVGCKGGELFKTVNSIIGDPKFGVALNPGHYIGTDEWVNSSIYEDSPIEIHSGSHIQCDIIAAGTNPVITAICEDTVIIADEQLRNSLRDEYPEVFNKIQLRQKFMREVLKINICDDVLPMSELNGVMFPYMLNPELIFTF